MKISCFLALCLCVVPGLLAADSRSFAFPSAVLRIFNDSWEKSFEIEVAKAPDSRGSVVKEFGNPTDDSRVRREPLVWQFVGRSDFGDVYVVVFEKKNGGKDIVPVVFDGTVPAVVERGSMRLEISLPRK